MFKPAEISANTPLLPDDNKTKDTWSAKLIKSGLFLIFIGSVAVATWVMTHSSHTTLNHAHSINALTEEAEAEDARMASWTELREQEKEDWDWDINSWVEIDWESVVTEDFSNELYVLVKTSEPIDARKANRICYDRYRTLLASIHSEGEQMLAKDVCMSSGKPAGDMVWFGLNDAASHGKEHEAEWRYKDMTAVDWTNWAEGNPDLTDNNDNDCTVLKDDDYFWHNVNCGELLNWFMCNAPSTRYVAIQRLQNWRKQADECFHRYNAPLAIIHSPADNYAVARVCGVWCMCIPDFDCDGCAIGMSDRWDEGTWDTWMNGEAVDYTNWLEGEPSNTGKGRASEDFAILNVMVRNNKWYDISARQTNIMGVCDLEKAGGLGCCRWNGDDKGGKFDEERCASYAAGGEERCLENNHPCFWEDRCRCCRYDDRAPGDNKKKRLTCPAMKGDDACEADEWCKTDHLNCWRPSFGAELIFE